MDETRWPMYCLPEGKLRQKWWSWVVVTPEVTAFLLEPTRSGQVPRDFFPKGTEGIVNVDRYAGYFGLLGSDWKIKLAYCWAHQRRDSVNWGEGCRRWALFFSLYDSGYLLEVVSLHAVVRITIVFVRAQDIRIASRPRGASIISNLSS